MSSPFPDPTNVLNSATSTRATLQLELSRHRLPDSLTTADIQRLLQQVTHDGQDLSQRDWDSAAQVYLATVSLHQADRLAKGRVGLEPQVEPLLKSLRDQLSFPAKFDSPRDYGKPRIDLFREQLSKLEGLIVKP